MNNQASFFRKTVSLLQYFSDSMSGLLIGPAIISATLLSSNRFPIVLVDERFLARKMSPGRDPKPGSQRYIHGHCI